MKKNILLLIIMILITVTGCNNIKNNAISKKDIEDKINVIVISGPLQSSNPYDYINENKDIYNELLNSPKSYIEALLCSEINTNFIYDFESASDYLNNYKIYLNSTDKLNEYDKYAKSLLK